MKRFMMGAFLAVSVLLLAGCGPYRYTRYERVRAVPADTLRLMSMADIISLTNARVGDDVIISQIQSTGSYFDLSTQDVIDLAKAGVSDKVINAMIKAEGPPPERQQHYYYGYAPYYWYPYSWYPWYSSFRYSPYRSYYRYGYGHSWYRGGGHGYGARRTTGRHR